MKVAWWLSLSDTSSKFKQLYPSNYFTKMALIRVIAKFRMFSFEWLAIESKILAV